MASGDRKLFVGGLPSGVDRSKLRDDFLPFGDIDDVYLPTDRVTGKLRGFAFVTFKNPEGAHQAAGAMHNKDYYGRSITVTIAKPRDSGPDDRSSSGASRSPHNHNGRYQQPRAYGPDPGPPRERSRSPERRAERVAPNYTHGNSYDGSGRYGARDTRPVQSYYD